MSWHPGFGTAENQPLPDHGVYQYLPEFYQQKDRSTTEQLQDPESANGVFQFSNHESAASSRTGSQLLSNAENTSSDSILGNTIAGFETLAVSGSGRQSLESEVCPRVAQNQYSYPQPQMYCRQSHGAGPHFSYPELDSGATFVPYHNNQLPYGHQPQALQYPSSYDLYALAQGLVCPSQDSAVYAQHTSPDFLPIQYPAEVPYGDRTATAPQIAPKRSKELIGMGLYDDKNGSMFASLDCVGVGASGLGDSLGKGLKLEETWKPPGAADAQINEADEGYSTDDAEEELPIALSPQEAQTQVLPVAGDLSNQTFFFDSDEQYNNYISFDQGLSACCSKPPDLVPGNFLWF